MTESNQFEGETIEEAIEKAVNEFKVAKEDMDIEILEQPSKGLLGIGGKVAKIIVSVKSAAAAVPQETLSEILELMGVEATVETEDLEDHTGVNISGENLGMLIGRHGHTLDALQYLVNIMINKNSLAKKRIILDVEGYRKQKTDEIKAMTERVIGKVLIRQRPMTLRPMNAFERKLVHTVVGEYSGVSSISSGEEPERKVVISPAKAD